MSDFSDYPFTAGSLIGLRAFEVDGLGRLVGPSYGQVFRPGQNDAVCKAGQYRPVLTTSPGSPFWDLRVSLGPASKSGTNDSHRVGDPACSCGFYAYFDGTNTYDKPGYDKPGRVTAIVEGYGVCSYGDRGFRAEKARLVALVAPTRARGLARLHVAYDRWADFLHHREVLGALTGVPAGLIGLVALVCSFLAMPATLLLLPLALMLMAYTVVTFKADFHGVSRFHHTVSPEVSGCPLPPPRSSLAGSGVAAVLANYPEVPVYPSVKAALAAHPLTVPEPEPLPTPESHTDFWEMEVPR